MDPYSVIVDEIVILHNPEYSHSEQYQQITNVSFKVKRWVRCEYFYSWIDKSYFEENELSTCLKQLGIAHNSFRRVEWILIRQSLGKTRRFSQNFIKEEREKLRKFREISRDLISKNGVSNFENNLRTAR
jgi:hypothetical protein